MGYTEEELVNSFSEHIGAIVQERKKEGILQTKDDVIEEIRTWYNGYRFSRADLSVYNPFSTLNYMDEKYPRTYWYNSGTSSFLVDELKKHSDSMVSLDDTIATEEELMNISFIDGVDVTALMYQTGYFTIQGFNTISKRYSLGLPNEEVRSAFTNSLVKNFTNIPKLRASEAFIKALENFQPGFVFKHLEPHFLALPIQSLWMPRSGPTKQCFSRCYTEWDLIHFQKNLPIQDGSTSR